MTRAASDAFKSLGIEFSRLRTWYNVQEPDFSEGEYPDIYPHVHHNDKATTIVIYLDPGDVPAPLEILAEDEIVQTIIPVAGMGVVIPNGVWHQVHKNRGTMARVANIVTAYP